MKPFRQFTVVPLLPAKLEPLREIALNLWWCWDYEAIHLFRHLDADLWEEVYHNPLYMLGMISQEQLEAASKNDAFLAYLDVVCRKFRQDMTKPSWFEQNFNGTDYENICIAYFSAEFGLTECLPLYSGGLGVLAGDHLKSASYIGLPFVAVGLLYQHGYFRQSFTADGWQAESYPSNDFYNMPIQLEHKADGSPVMVTVDYPIGKVYARVWRAQVGRVPLYLLDTNIPENTDAVLRNITKYLYGGDSTTRIQQDYTSADFWEEF